MLDKSDLASAEDVQRSSSLQLITLNTGEVDEFLSFIAGNAEFSNLELDLRNDAVLTQATFKALQEMQGYIKSMALHQVGQCDKSEILAAMNNKSLQSLKLFNSGAGSSIDLRPWLATPLTCLTLHDLITDASTFAEAIGSSLTLKTLEITVRCCPTGATLQIEQWPRLTPSRLLFA